MPLWGLFGLSLGRLRPSERSGRGAGPPSSGSDWPDVLEENQPAEVLDEIDGADLHLCQ